MAGSDRAISLEYANEEATDGRVSPEVQAMALSRVGALASMHNCIRLEVRFRALLTQDEIQKLEVVRA